MNRSLRNAKTKSTKATHHYNLETDKWFNITHSPKKKKERFKYEFEVYITSFQWHIFFSNGKFWYVMVKIMKYHDIYFANGVLIHMPPKGNFSKTRLL